MRTKTLLLAVAALATGIISSEAQNVYSQNIVGYVNAVSPVGGQFTLLANPLDSGTNTISALFPSAPNQTQVEIWNGGGFTSSLKTFGNWSTNLLLYPGTGFFIKYPVASGAVTNTFVGNVVALHPNGVDGGGTNTVALPTSFVLVGSTFPLSDTLTGTNINLGPSLANQSVVEVWNGTSFVSALKTFGNWSTNLNLAVAQGYFVNSKAATNWTEILP
jgi:hypothetical protein